MNDGLTDIVGDKALVVKRANEHIKSFEEGNETCNEERNVRKIRLCNAQETSGHPRISTDLPGPTWNGALYGRVSLEIP